MTKAKRVFVIADFKDESPRSIRIERRRWPKGFILAGCDVQRFSYRNVLMQFNPFGGRHFRRFMPKFVRRYADRILAEQVRVYHPNIVFIGGMKYLTAETIDVLRRAAPQAVFVGRDNDPFPELNQERLAIAQKLDVVTTTGADSFLRTYKQAGVPLCAFMPNPCDPDIQCKYDDLPQWKCDIIFTGKAGHKRLDDVEEKDRKKILETLSSWPAARLYGCFGRPTIEGIEAFMAISGAKLALSINATHAERLYHSDRLVNCIACGTMTLAKRVPDTDLLFEDKKHVRYFDTAEEFFDICDWYLKHDAEREKIAAAGMEHAHKEFNCTKIAGLLLDLVEKGSYDAPWKVIL